MRTIPLLMLLFGSLLPAQYDPTVDEHRYFEANYSFSLSGAAGTLTIKAPSTSTRSVVPVDALICSTATVVITQEKGGTATGGTAVTPTALNNAGSPEAAQVLRGATTGSGVAVGLPITVGADECSQPISLARIKLPKGTGGVYNIKTDSVTATVKVSVIFAETRR